MAPVGRSPELLVNLPLARTAVDRAAERRSDPDLVPQLLADPATRVLAVRDGSAEVSADGSRPALVLRPPLPADAHALAVFLGVDGGGTAYVAVDHDAASTVGTTARSTKRMMFSIVMPKKARLHQSSSRTRFADRSTLTSMKLWKNGARL